MTPRTGIIEAISVSDQRGIPKSNVSSANLIVNWGIEGDAHAGDWHRQVSILALESVERMRELGADVHPGDFAENLTIRGLEVPDIRVGDRIRCGEVELEVTQIGKECHGRCRIYYSVGDCVMPREGIFARVIAGGLLRPGMEAMHLPSGSE